MHVVQGMRDARGVKNRRWLRKSIDAKMHGNVRDTLRIAQSTKIHVSTETHRPPGVRALAYIVASYTRYPRLRLDSESINPRNYFHRDGGGGGGSRVIDAYSYELA